MTVAEHIDTNDPQYAEAAAELLRRHQSYEQEANITSAVRDFLVRTGLAKHHEIKEENPPSDTSRRAVDLTALDTFIEVKRRIGTAKGNDPNPVHVQQLDDYLESSKRDGNGFRTGVLTDGKYWLLRWPGAGAIRTTLPYAFTLESSDKWLLLYEWLRDTALTSLESIPPDSETVEKHLGPKSPLYERDIAGLTALYQENAHYETVKVKRRLWHDLLRAALGEVATSPEQLDDLFVRHTYLTIMIGMVVQASFGIDIRQMAANDAEDLLNGHRFRNDTGLQGVVESDFFTWPTEVGGLPMIRTLARRVARFDWSEAPADIAATLYETIIPPEERKQLGEYYTPDWLARQIVREVVTDPLNQRVLDPSCGSGTFLAEAVTNFIDAAKRQGIASEEVFSRLRDAVTGIDIHPVAVHLARAAWVLAAKSAIQASHTTNITIPVYLGDSMQLRFRTGDLFAQDNVTIEVDDEYNSALAFPMTLVRDAETFDSLMNDITEHIENGDDPEFALNDNQINNPLERETLQDTIKTLQNLHQEGRNHIWAYYTRNLVRPVVLGNEKVDVIVGNPPWINFNKTSSILRTELERQSKHVYNIWAGGRYATHQDVAGLFYTRCVDLYLKESGAIGMVMPHSALQTGQYSKWRSGNWSDKASGQSVHVNFAYKPAWDLERLQPNTFFPIPASVVFAKREFKNGRTGELRGNVQRWIGETGSHKIQRILTPITDTSARGGSPYAGHAMQGATIVPRRLFFVNLTAPSANIRVGNNTVTVEPRQGSYDKSPWKDINLAQITNQTIETDHLFDVHLGETVVPYATLEPLKAILPLKQGDAQIPTDEDGVGGISLGGLDRRMRLRWQLVSRLWEENKARANKLNLLGRLDYYGNLSSQLKWQHNAEGRPVRLMYNSSGAPTAALVDDRDTLVDYTLFWVACKDTREANYLLAIINSDALAESVDHLMPKGQFGARHLQKHLWKLPIPEFDAGDELHLELSEAGKAAAEGVAVQLEQLRQERERVTVIIARREIRQWLRESEEGRAVEEAVSRLLG